VGERRNNGEGERRSHTLERSKGKRMESSFVMWSAVGLVILVSVLVLMFILSLHRASREHSQQSDDQMEEMRQRWEVQKELAGK